MKATATAMVYKNPLLLDEEEDIATGATLGGEFRASSQEGVLLEHDQANVTPGPVTARTFVNTYSPWEACGRRGLWNQEYLSTQEMVWNRLDFESGLDAEGSRVEQFVLGIGYERVVATYADKISTAFRPQCPIRTEAPKVVDLIPDVEYPTALVMPHKPARSYSARVVRSENPRITLGMSQADLNAITLWEDNGI
jgi:hypothetical protein